MQITSREQFKEYCLRRLGHPVIKVNVDDLQVEDRIDDALQFFFEYHFDGYQRRHYPYQLTASDLTNKYIDTDTIDRNIMTITRLFETDGDAMGMFNIRYQMALNDVFNLRQGHVDMTSYAIAQTYVAGVQQMLNPESALSFSKSSNRLYIETDWTNWGVGKWLVFEAHTAMDPEVFTETYNNRDLKDYAVALVKLQWGLNLSKFLNASTVGGIQMNGQAIKEEAMQEKILVEGRIRSTNEEPPSMQVG